MPQSFQLFVENRPADAAFRELVDTIEVEENADLPGAIQMTLPIAIDGENLTVVGDDRVKPFARIAVVITADGEEDQCIFDGHVLSHQVHLDRGITQSTVKVWGQDMTCVMNLVEKVKEWTVSDGTIANTIFRDDYSFQVASGNTEDDSGAHPESAHTVMQRGTDAQFLRDRARRAGKLFRVCADRPGRSRGYFIKPNVGGAPAATLILNPVADANIETLDVAWDVARPTQVLAKALIRAKDPVDGGAQTSGLANLASRSLASLTSGHEMKVMLAGYIDDVGELRSRAQSILREGGWFVRCECEADLARLGAVIRVATVVEVRGAGTVLSGNYFVWSVRHTITALSHRMKLVLVRNALGAA